MDFARGPDLHRWGCENCLCVCMCNVCMIVMRVHVALRHELVCVGGGDREWLRADPHMDLALDFHSFALMFIVFIHFHSLANHKTSLCHGVPWHPPEFEFQPEFQNSQAGAAA